MNPPLPRKKILVYAYHIYRAWYNGLHPIATKPIKFLQLQYTMTQFLIIVYTTQVNSAFRAL